MTPASAASSLERPRGGVARASHDPPPGEKTHAGHPRTSTGRCKSSRLRSVIDFIEPISSGVRRTGIAHLPEPAGRKHCRVWLAPLFIKGRSDSAEPVDSISWVGRCAQKAGNAVTAWNRVETNRDPASLHQPPVLGSARAVTPPTPASSPLIAVGLLVTFAEWQPRDGTAPNWPGANGRPLRGCRSRSRARQVSRRASTIAHGLRSSSCKLRRPAPHIAMESADARLRSGEAGFFECSKPGRVRHRNQRFGSTFCRWLSPAWC